MTTQEICAGQKQDWALQRKLGEGDAGEVFRVVPANAEPGPDAQIHSAILKRPRKSPFQADVIRQSSQIDTEGRVLRALAEIPLPPSASFVYTPALLDQARFGSEQTDRFFIVIEAARGFDLSFLSRVALMGREVLSESPANLSPEMYLFLHSMSEYAGAENSAGGTPASENSPAKAARRGHIPEAILLKTLGGLLEFLEQIHRLACSDGEKTHHGILWNDVKPEHLFWDPVLGRLTIIDWGNGRFLEEDGATEDRQNSSYDDYRQFLDGMGRFLDSSAPELKARLKWPAAPIDENIQALKKRIEAGLAENNKQLKKARQKEIALVQAGPEPGGRRTKKQDPLQALVEVQKQIVALGEMPDYKAALPFSSSYAEIFIRENRLDALSEVADWVGMMPESDAAHWQLISQLSRAANRAAAEAHQRKHFSAALTAAAADEWENTLWEAARAFQGQPEPDWWRDLVLSIRARRLELGPDAVLPIVSVRRVLMALQASSRLIEDRNRSTSSYYRSNEPRPAVQDESEQLTTLRSLISRLRESVLPNWVRLDPMPPHGSPAYSEIQAFLGDLQTIQPELAASIEINLEQPRRQAEAVLQAWNRKEFTLAGRALRLLLVWDPDRLRVLKAEQAILSAPSWLDHLHAGPGSRENLQDFATQLELEGRELRNQVGPASWLDPLLEALKQLRRGAWPGDLLADAYLAREMTWLDQFRRRGQLPGGADNTSSNGELPLFAAPPALQGVREARMGESEDLEIYEPLDAWIPEARGSSARVFLGHLKNEAGQPYPAAIKLMRVDHAGYALPLFHEEVEVLNRMAGIPGVTPLIECGFMRFGEKVFLPGEPFDGSTSGDLVRMGLDQSRLYQDELSQRVKDGWVPYLAIEKREPNGNLAYLCDAGLRAGRFLPLTDLVRMSIQICEILQMAHERQIVYRDHKILHYYWEDATNGIYVIDWNVARYHPNGLSDIEIHMDLVQFAARALHHILTGRTAPGALPLGPTRPDEIEQAAESYTAQWTYDDQRLTGELKELIEKGLAGTYTSARQLAQDLKLAYLRIG